MCGKYLYYLYRMLLNYINHILRKQYKVKEDLDYAETCKNSWYKLYLISNFIINFCIDN